MKSRLESILAVLLTLSALLMAGAVVKREFFGDAIASAATNVRAEFHEEWLEARAVGIELANADAPLQIIEFLDIACSACALYHERVIAPFIRSVSPADYSLLVVHRPLEMHEFALPAAHAAECADEQELFSLYVEAAMKDQSSFHSAPWDALAERVGIADVALFSACMNADREFARISGGVDLAKRMGVNATPTLLINGWEPPLLPNLESLKAMKDGARDGRNIRELVQSR